MCIRDSFQPISYFGIYPEDKIRRITIPGVIRRVAEQHPDISEADFGPGTCEHPQCSFQACYMRDRQGRLRPLTRFAPHKPESGAVHHVRASLRRTWLPGRTELLTVGDIVTVWVIEVDEKKKRIGLSMKQVPKA